MNYILAPFEEDPTNGRAESANNALLPARHENPLGFLEKVGMHMLKSLRKVTQKMEKYNREGLTITKYASKEYAAQHLWSQQCEVVIANNDTAHVTNMGAGSPTRRLVRFVNGNFECDCLETQQCERPCRHVIAFAIATET